MIHQGPLDLTAGETYYVAIGAYSVDDYMATGTLTITKVGTRGMRGMTCTPLMLTSIVFPLRAPPPPSFPTIDTQHVLGAATRVSGQQ